MGTDIHIRAQKQVGGEWVDVFGYFTEGSAPFNWRSYGLFGFLAGVRNYSAVPPIAPQRGLPVDFDAAQFEELHSASWLSVAELARFDYDQQIEDRRIVVQIAPNTWSGAGLANEGEGKATTYRDFLRGAFFSDLEELKRIGAERIVFAFDY